jgi:hypothetical protein
MRGAAAAGWASQGLTLGEKRQMNLKLRGATRDQRAQASRRRRIHGQRRSERLRPPRLLQGRGWRGLDIALIVNAKVSLVYSVRSIVVERMERTKGQGRVYAVGLYIL